MGFLIIILVNGEGYEIILELDVYKEGFFRDKFVFKNEVEEEFVIVFYVRVFGVRKGIFMLKEGIRCIYYVKDEEGEYSDWIGFE